MCRLIKVLVLDLYKFRPRDYTVYLTPLGGRLIP